MFPERNFQTIKMFPERNFQTTKMFPERRFEKNPQPPKMESCGIVHQRKTVYFTTHPRAGIS